MMAQALFASTLLGVIMSEAIKIPSLRITAEDFTQSRELNLLKMSFSALDVEYPFLWRLNVSCEVD
jgi:hypothetical protein